MCNGNKKEGFTTFSSDLGFGVVMVRNVPANICSQCGEEWIAANTEKSLEIIVNNAKIKHSLVEVVASI